MVRTISVELFIMLAIGLLLGLIGPFGTFEIQTGTRMAFWVVASLAGYAIFRPFVIVSKWVSEALNVPQIVSGGLALLIAALPLTFLIALFFADFDGQRALASNSLPKLYFQVWLIGFVINAVFVLTLGRADMAPIATDMEAGLPPQTPPAMVQMPDRPARLPVTLGAIHALRGEDHYVRVIGERGEQLVLMRLRDAIADLEASAGVQVHRSWWVAADGVAKVTRTGRTAEILLKNGSVVPVSRDMMPRLRDLRWL